MCAYILFYAKLWCCTYILELQSIYNRLLTKITHCFIKMTSCFLYQLKIVSRIFHVTVNTLLALCQKRCETNESIKGYQSGLNMEIKI